MVSGRNFSIRHLSTCREDNLSLSVALSSCNFFCEKQKRTAASKACASKQPLVYCEEKSCKEKSGGSAEHCSSPRSCPCEKKKKKFKLAGLLAAYNIPRPGSGRTTGNTSANSGSLSDTAPVPHRLSVVVSQTWN